MVLVVALVLVALRLKINYIMEYYMLGLLGRDKKINHIVPVKQKEKPGWNRVDFFSYQHPLKLLKSTMGKYS